MMWLIGVRRRPPNASHAPSRSDLARRGPSSRARTHSIERGQLPLMTLAPPPTPSGLAARSQPPPADARPFGLGRASGHCPRATSLGIVQRSPLHRTHTPKSTPGRDAGRSHRHALRDAPARVHPRSALTLSQRLGGFLLRSGTRILQRVADHGVHRVSTDRHPEPFDSSRPPASSRCIPALRSHPLAQQRDAIAGAPRGYVTSPPGHPRACSPHPLPPRRFRAHHRIAPLDRSAPPPSREERPLGREKLPSHDPS